MAQALLTSSFAPAYTLKGNATGSVGSVATAGGAGGASGGGKLIVIEHYGS